MYSYNTSYINIKKCKHTLYFHSAYQMIFDRFPYSHDCCESDTNESRIWAYLEPKTSYKIN